MSPSPARLLGFATASPPHVLRQADAAAAAAELYGETAFRTPLLLSLFANTGIDTRQTVRPLDWYAQRHDWRERNAVYLEGAEALYLEAARAALADAGVEADEVGTVVTVSTTGIATPSLEARLHGRLGLRADVVRAPVFGLGCAGGVSGLQLAARLAMADPGRAVLLVVVEICSVAVRTDAATKANVVASALFGDGAAAAVVRAGVARDADARTVGPGVQHLWPDTLDIMGWTVDPQGFGIVLSVSLPAFVQRRFGEAVAGLKPGEGAAPDRFVCHPGGARVLPALEGVMGLETGALDAEREVLAAHGNMSAPTVWFVLDRLRRRGDDGGALTMAALGPGFTASFAPLGARAGAGAAA